MEFRNISIEGYVLFLQVSTGTSVKRLQMTILAILNMMIHSSRISKTLKDSNKIRTLKFQYKRSMSLASLWSLISTDHANFLKHLLVLLIFLPLGNLLIMPALYLVFSWWLLLWRRAYFFQDYFSFLLCIYCSKHTLWIT